MNKTYKLAVIIPNWNSAKYISKLLDGILNQDFEDWQTFIIDDQSTDDSVNIINEYVKRDSRIHLHIRDISPKGAQTCKNIGVELSEGAEYLVFFDSDDEIANYCFSQRVTFMDHHPTLDFAIFPAKAFLTSHYDSTAFVYGYEFYDDTLKAILHRTLPIVGWTNIFRRDQYLAKQIDWDVHLISLLDTDFDFQAIIKGCTFEYAEKTSKIDIKPDYFYSQSDKNTKLSSKIYSKSHCQNVIYIINKIISSLDEEQLKKYKESILCFIIHFLLWAEDRRTLVKGLLRNSWIRRQTKVYLFLRLYAIAFTSNRLLILLFNKTNGRIKKQNEEWKYLMENKTKELISLYGKDTN